MGSIMRETLSLGMSRPRTDAGWSGGIARRRLASFLNSVTPSCASWTNNVPMTADDPTRTLESHAAGEDKRDCTQQMLRHRHFLRIGLLQHHRPVGFRPPASRLSKV